MHEIGIFLNPLRDSYLWWAAHIAYDTEDINLTATQAAELNKTEYSGHSVKGVIYSNNFQEWYGSLTFIQTCNRSSGLMTKSCPMLNEKKREKKQLQGTISYYIFLELIV